MSIEQRKPFGDDTESLSRQISRTANRLDRRKKVATALGVSLRSRIRTGWASPRVLWIAGCTGFLAAEWLHRPSTEQRPARKQPSKSPRRPPQTAIMPNVVLLLKFAEDLRKLWAKANPGSAAGVRQRTDERRPNEHAVNEPGF